MQVDILTSANAAMDPAVFTFASDILKVYSTDPAKISAYDLLIKVKFTGGIYSY